MGDWGAKCRVTQSMRGRARQRRSMVRCRRGRIAAADRGGGPARAVHASALLTRKWRVAVDRTEQPRGAVAAHRTGGARAGGLLGGRHGILRPPESPDHWVRKRPQVIQWPPAQRRAFLDRPIEAVGPRFSWAHTPRRLVEEYKRHWSSSRWAVAVSRPVGLRSYTVRRRSRGPARFSCRVVIGGRQPVVRRQEA